MQEKTKGYKRKRTRAVIKLENGREIPATLSCRSDGECVVLPRPMVEHIFPKEKKKSEIYKLRK